LDLIFTSRRIFKFWWSDIFEANQTRLWAVLFPN